MVKEIDPNLTPEQVRPLSLAEQMAVIKFIQVHYPRFQKLLEQIRECCGNNVNPSSPPGSFIVGCMGVGRTSLLEIISNEHPKGGV